MKKLFIIAILQIAFSELTFSQYAANVLKLWYMHPASKWLESLPIGNGSLGAMIYGGVEQEHIQFNEESLVTGTTQTVGFYQPFGEGKFIFHILPDKNNILDHSQLTDINTYPEKYNKQ